VSNPWVFGFVVTTGYTRRRKLRQRNTMRRYFAAGMMATD
jgi:hypothetical protein